MHHEGPPGLRPAALFVWVVCAALALAGCVPPEPEAQATAAGHSAGPAQGKWRTVRGADVKALPYLQGYRAAEPRPTISRHDRSAAFQGLNLYVSGHAAEAVLMDMDGRVLHRWRYPLRRLWPDLAADPTTAKLEYWRRVYLYPNGDLLAIYEGHGLVKLDARSNVLWSVRGGIHHDLSVTPEGEIWVLDRQGKVLPRIHPTAGILEDLVTVLDPQGRLLGRLSLLRAFERSRYASLLGRMAASGDVFHTNTLEVLDGRFAVRDPAFARGNLLVSVRQLDALAIVDPERREVVWAKTGGWRRQHQPAFLDNGNLLLFDNLGPARDRSRVIELDPRTGAIAWQYGGTRETDFFSRTLGSCQRLPNGNTLITESENGRALEVTPSGRIVWEFYNPHRAGERDELVAVLFEMERLPAGFPFRGLGR